MGLLSLAFNYAGDPAPVQTTFTGESRYFFTGLALLWLILVLGFEETRTAGGFHHRVAKAVLVIALTSGVIDAVGYWEPFQGVEPRWREQVAAWRKDPGHAIRVAPPGWQDRVQLRPR
jgi:hypothetical protein